MKKIHLICNAHIDPVWHWRLSEGIGAAISTFRIAAEIAENDDTTFIFNHNEAILYEHIERYDNELFTHIQELVKKGKWHIMGGWYLQPDCDKPTGESIVRQITRGQKYFKEKFGVSPTTSISFDAFGHSKGLIQILNKCGYDSYIFGRPNAFSSNTTLPSHTFRWQGFADSEVIASCGSPYAQPFGLTAQRLKDFINNNSTETNSVRMFLWGVGNHGGGPSKLDLENINELISETSEVEILHSTPESYFAEIKFSDLPIYDKSLSQVMVGCYTSQAKIKQLHRSLENALKTAEIMASHASASSGMKYPYDKLQEAEDCLLLSQFHDILPGSSSKDAMEYSNFTISRGLDLTEQIKTEAFYLLSTGQKCGEREIIPLLVYNPTPYEDIFTIESEFTLADQNFSLDFFSNIIVKQDEQIIPSQLEKEDCNIPTDWRKKIVFRAKLQPMAMNRFDLYVERIDKRPTITQPNQSLITVEGENHSVTIDTSTGLINKYIVNGTEILNKPCGSLCVINDDHDPWGMLVKSFKNVSGYFHLANDEETAKICNVSSKTLKPVHVIEEGDIRTVIEAVFCYEACYAIVRYYIYKNTSEFKVGLKLFSSLKHKMVKYCIPTAFSNAKVSGKTVFGCEELLDNGDEIVSQEYITVSDSNNSLSVIKQGTYGASFENDELRISLIRGANFCAHPISGRFTTPQDRFNDCIDNGESVFEFYLNASSLEERNKSIEREATRISQHPEVISFYPSGKGEKPKSLCEITNTVISLERLSRKSDNSYILHLYNSSNDVQSTDVLLTVENIKFSVNMKPYEVLSYIIKDKKVLPCDLNDY